MQHLVSILCLTLTVFTYVAESKQSDKNTCIEHKTCGECIMAGRKCGWCTQEGYDADNKVRCDMIENLLPNGCDDAFIIKPKNNATYTENLEVRNAKGGHAAIQLAPQKMKIHLRPNTPYSFPVTFRLAENYPVDLYYVMDLSYSMEDDKKKLAELGDLLAQGMSNITKNFRLGFGSFVDKKTMPYVSMIPKKLIEPCPKCVAPYGFHNQMPLTDNTPEFEVRVNAADISGNLDGPEGGFDAMMQAIVCEDDIGWRVNTRKMLVYSSDAPFHCAGDGKLGGIVKPNDGECHMVGDYYSESLNQDYPSISQLSHKIAEKKVNVIFAITGNQKETYDKLAKFIEGSVVGQLANDSSNIVELVRSNYEKISSSVELKTEGADNINVLFKTNCFGDTAMNTARCDKLKIGQSVTFNVTLEAMECSKNRDEWKKTFSIYPVGLAEKLIIDVELMCECNCEHSSQEEVNSDKCNKNGTFECGACTCRQDHFGKTCECTTTDIQSEDFTSTCRRTNTSEICSSRGQCICGICDCDPITPGDSNKKWRGNYCDCDDFSCDYFDNKLCGGPTHGKCVCGECSCNPTFTGRDCACPIGEEPCRAKNNLICNGKGTCICGQCVCDLDTFYRGPTCEDCPTCAGRCEQNKACVQCRAFESGPLSDEECVQKCQFVEVVSTIEEDQQTSKMCQFRDDDDCMFYFAYDYNSPRVQAQRTKECPKPVNVRGIVLGVVLGIVFIGLALLLIWKLLTTISDRRELAKFEKERENARWDAGENPIYKEATSHYKNPTYKGQ